MVPTSWMELGKAVGFPWLLIKIAPSVLCSILMRLRVQVLLVSQLNMNSMVHNPVAGMVNLLLEVLKVMLEP